MVILSWLQAHNFRSYPVAIVYARFLIDQAFYQRKYYSAYVVLHMTCGYHPVPSDKLSK